VQKYVIYYDIAKTTYSVTNTFRVGVILVKKMLQKNYEI